MNRSFTYLGELADSLGDSWNRFWFTPASTRTLGVVRIAVAACALVYVLGFSFDLSDWFGRHGILSVDTLRQITGAENSVVYRFSLFYLSEIPGLRNVPGMIWLIHGLGIVILVAVLIGWQTRWMLPLSLLVVLSYVHRAPILSGTAEPVLCMALFYLTIGYLRLPSLERSLSVDQLRAQKKAFRNASGSPAEHLPWETRGVCVNVALRLIQVHLVGFYVVMGLTQLSGETWWIGEAVWSLLASRESQWFDFQSWGQSSLLIGLWTYEIVIFEFAFAVLIWFRIWRPLLIGLSVLHWLGIMLLTASPDLSLIMIASGFAFAPATWFGATTGKNSSSSQDSFENPTSDQRRERLRRKSVTSMR